MTDNIKDGIKLNRNPWMSTSRWTLTHAASGAPILDRHTRFERKWLAEWARDYMLAHSPVDYTLPIEDINERRDEWEAGHREAMDYVLPIVRDANHPARPHPTKQELAHLPELQITG